MDGFFLIGHLTTNKAYTIDPSDQKTSSDRNHSASLEYLAIPRRVVRHSRVEKGTLFIHLGHYPMPLFPQGLALRSPFLEGTSLMLLSLHTACSSVFLGALFPSLSAANAGSITSFGHTNTIAANDLSRCISRFQDLVFCLLRVFIEAWRVRV